MIDIHFKSQDQIRANEIKAYAQRQKNHQAHVKHIEEKYRKMKSLVLTKNEEKALEKTELKRKYAKRYTASLQCRSGLSGLSDTQMKYQVIWKRCKREHPMLFTRLDFLPEVVTKNVAHAMELVLSDVDYSHNYFIGMAEKCHFTSRRHNCISNHCMNLIEFTDKQYQDALFELMLKHIDLSAEKYPEDNWQLQARLSLVNKYKALKQS